MKITQSENPYNFPSARMKAAPAPPTTKNSVPATTSNSVSLSGEALLITHLYGGELNPPFETVLDTTKSGKYYLTKADRDLLARIYEFAQEQGAAPRYVTSLARELADYRQFKNGALLGSLNSGDIYDIEGHQLSYSFIDKDAATAARILDGEAIKGSALDQGFLRYLLDPGYSAFNICDFDFLEKVVTRFSTTGDPEVALAPHFQTYQRHQSYIEHKSREILNPLALERLAKQKQEATGQNPTAPPPAPGSEKTETLKDIWRRSLLQMVRNGGWQSSLATFLSRNRNG
ncbi:hypothetical protein [Pseudomonas gingeri]|uniref:Uncharacterized protein n=1 Tax=Pseudomonas gingeri TaxID=117681 RepID=A0A7Y7YH41_9PSED|nr:hypothetical protein [Pseudomonas gingeri]NWB29570.1 hypothetical protein [Pseudomonas gingeri]NWC36429.1 hypothetical protein [Pseudomonas gingeri]